MKNSLDIGQIIASLVFMACTVLLTIGTINMIKHEPVDTYTIVLAITTCSLLLIVTLHCIRITITEFMTAEKWRKEDIAHHAGLIHQNGDPVLSDEGYPEDSDI